MFEKHPVHRGKLVAVADVGSASAAVALVSLRHGAPAEVLAAERSILSMEERSQKATITAIGAHLVQAGENIMKAYKAQAGQSMPVEELYCIIRAPWCRSLTVQARSEQKEAVKVTDAMIGALAKEAVSAQKELDTKRILEASVVRVELNGYPTGTPAGKPAHEIEVWSLVSDCIPAMRSEVETSLQKVFPHLTPAFRSSTRTTLSVLKERPVMETNFLIVDIGGESTTLVVVREGAIAEQHLVEEGVRGMLKRITPTGMPEETLGLIRMLERDQCSTAACEAIQSAIAKIEPELVRTFGEGMGACAARQRLPDQLILIVQQDLAPWLAKFFSRIDFTQFTLTTRPFSVTTVVPKDLVEWAVPARGVVLDTGMALACALIGKEQST